MNRIFLALVGLIFFATAASAEWVEGPRFTTQGAGPSEAGSGACDYADNSLGKRVPSCSLEEWACTHTFHFPNNTESWLFALDWETPATDTDNGCFMMTTSCYPDGADLTTLDPAAGGTRDNTAIVIDAASGTADEARITANSTTVVPFDVNGNADCASDACDAVTCRVCVWRESTGCTGTEITEDILFNAVQVDKNQ